MKIRFLYYGLGILSGLAGLFMLGGYLAIKHLDVTAYMQQHLDGSVKVKAQILTWHHFLPAIQLQQVAIETAQYTIKAEHVHAQMAWWQSLKSRSVKLGQLRLISPQIQSSSTLLGEEVSLAASMRHLQLAMEGGGLSAVVPLTIKNGTFLQIQDGAQQFLIQNLKLKLISHRFKWDLKIQGLLKKGPDINLPTSMQGQIKGHFLIQPLKESGMRAKGTLTISALKHAWLNHHKIDALTIDGQMDFNQQGIHSQVQLAIYPLKIKLPFTLQYHWSDREWILDIKKLILAPWHAFMPTYGNHFVYLDEAIINHLHLVFQDSEHWRLDALMAGLKWQPHLGIQIIDIEGPVTCSAHEGQATLEGVGVSSQCQGHKNPISADLYWQFEPLKGWRLEVQNARFKWCDLKGQFKGHWLAQNFIDISGTFKHPSVKQFAYTWLKYVPTNPLQAWLLRALNTSSTLSGRFQCQGPFEHIIKHMNIDVDMPNFDFLFNPQWWPLSKTDAHLHYGNGQLDMQFTGGHLHHIPITKAQAVLDVTQMPLEEVLIDIIAQVPIETLLTQLRQSPIGQQIPTLQLWRLAGMSDLKVHLVMPLAQPLQTAVNAHMHVSALQAWFQDNPHALGQDLVADLDISYQAQTLNLKGQGHGLMYLQPPRADHHITYRSRIDFAYHKNQTWQAHYNIALTQLAAHVPFVIAPKPFAALSMTGHASDGVAHMAIQNENHPLATITLNREARDRAFSSTETLGWHIKFDIEDWSVDTYQPLVHFVKKTIGSTIGLETDQLKLLVDMKFKQLRWHTLVFEHIHIRKQYLSPAWLYYQIRGPKIKGEIWQQLNDKNYILYFKHLTLAAYQAQKERKIAAVPYNVLLWIDNLYLQDRVLGRGSFQYVTDLVALQEITTFPLLKQLFVRQGWVRSLTKQPFMQFNMELNHPEMLIETMPGLPNWTGRYMHLMGTLYWPSSIITPGLADLKGEAFLQLQNGQIAIKNTKNGLGIGKWLNMLNVNHWPKRLSLDFRDMVKNAYFFDDVTCYFSVADRYIYVDWGVIQGPSADIELTGQWDIVKKALDLQANLIPKLTSGLPLLVGLAGGPIAGATTWLVDNVFGKALNRLNQYHYQIQGPLDALQVNKI